MRSSSRAAFCRQHPLRATTRAIATGIAQHDQPKCDCARIGRKLSVGYQNLRFQVYGSAADKLAKLESQPPTWPGAPAGLPNRPGTPSPARTLSHPTAAFPGSSSSGFCGSSKSIGWSKPAVTAARNIAQMQVRPLRAHIHIEETQIV